MEREYQPLENIGRLSLILDLGANVGYSAAYFLSRFPNSRVFAVEPDSRNVELCRLNLLPFRDRAVVIHGAVWSKPALLSIGNGTFGDGREWATQVVPTPAGQEGKVKGWDVASLLSMTGADYIDLLKIDIEGSEIEVFGESATEWLPRIRNLCIELHGPECSERFFKTMSGFEYFCEHSGELVICKNIKRRVQN